MGVSLLFRTAFISGTSPWASYPRLQHYARVMRGGETGSAGRIGSLIALRTVRTNSVCECVPVFWKTDLRELRAVSYLILSAFAQDRSDSPVIRRARRRASARVKLNRSLRNAI